MRTVWSLTLIALGAVLVHSTHNAPPGFSEIRAVGLALLAIGGAALLPRYPGTSHPGSPVPEPGPAPVAARVPAPRRHGASPVAAPVSGPAFARPAHQRIPLPALPAPGEPAATGHATVR
jgi:hypothetical protein